MWYAYSFGKGSLEGRNDILALDTVNIKTLCPSLEDTVVNILLSGRVREGETEGKLVQLLTFVVVLDELLQAVGDVTPELLGSAALQFFGHAVLGLDNVEFALGLWQVDFANTEVGAAHVEGEKGTGLVTSRKTHAPSGVHRLSSKALVPVIARAKNW